MDNDLQTLVQLIELYGKGLGALGRGIRFTAKTAKSGVDFAKVKVMQAKIRMHYASTGTHDTMKLSDLEKITGDQYNILNIPLEDDDKLIEFYDALKKMRVSFAELPDLMLGDGYTQIAYNPMDREKVKFVVGQWRNKLREEPTDMDVEDYVKSGGEQGEELLKQLAEKGYKDEMHVEHLAHMQDILNNQEYIPVSINIASLLVSEEKDRYIFRVPRSLTKTASEHAMIVKKDDVLLLDEGQTVMTAFKADDKVQYFPYTESKELSFDRALEMGTRNFCKAFAKVDKDKLKMVSKLSPNNADIFPSFNVGAGEEEQEAEGLEKSVDEESLSPEHQKVKDKTPAPTKQLAEILHLEQIKERMNNPEYIPVTFDMAQMVAEDQYSYVANLPGYMDEKEELVRCLALDKADVQVSEDGQRLMAYLKKTGESNVMEYNGDGKKIREFKVENEKLAGDVIKSQMERSKADKVPLKEIAKDVGETLKR